MQKEKLIKRNPHKGAKINQLLKKPRRLIITILLGNEFVNIAISSISAGVVIHFFGQETPWLNIVIVLPILLLFGEITPKTFAINNSEKFSSIVITPLLIFEKFITPLRWIIKNISDRIVNLIIRKKRRRGNILTEDVVRTIVDEGEKEGIVDSVEKNFIHKIFDFGDSRLHDVMTPRSNLFCLPFNMSLTEIIRQIKIHHYSAVPVYRENKDDIVGVVFATDLIGLTKEEIVNSEATLNKILRKPYIVPVSKRTDELFRTFQRKKISLALALDEFGGIAGLVTIEDLLEKIFGEIYDEFEIEDRQFEKIGDNIYKVKATMPIEEINNLLEIDLHSDEVDSIGGLVFDLFGEFPKEKSTLQYDDLHFTVDKISGNKIESIIVRKR